MKAVPYAVVGAAVLAGWTSSAHVAFAAEKAEISAQRSVCAAHIPDAAEDTGARPAQVRHVHGTSCSCSACSAKARSAQ